MVKEFTKGVFTTLVILFLFGIVFAVGFHTADEITSGTFVGNYKFQGDLDLTSANVSGISTSNKLDNSTTVCNSNNKGVLIYDQGLVKVCDGANWDEVGGDGESQGDEFTSLLMHFDGGFSDSSINNFGTIITGNPNSNSEGKFSNGVAFDGDDGIKVDASSQWNFGSSSFTIDFWMKTTATTRQHPLTFYSGSGDLLAFDINDGGNSLWVYWNGGGEYAVKTTVTLNNDNWHHIALVRDGNTFYLFVDGNQRDTFSYSNPIDLSACSGDIGKYSAFNYVGSIDELRISKGVARWTSDFTVPSGPYY